MTFFRSSARALLPLDKHNDTPVRPGQCLHCTGEDTLRDLYNRFGTERRTLKVTCVSCLGDTIVLADDADTVIAAGATWPRKLQRAPTLAIQQLTQVTQEYGVPSEVQTTLLVFAPVKARAA